MKKTTKKTAKKATKKAVKKVTKKAVKKAAKTAEKPVEKVTMTEAKAALNACITARQTLEKVENAYKALLNRAVDDLIRGVLTGENDNWVGTVAQFMDEHLWDTEFTSKS